MDTSDQQPNSLLPPLSQTQGSRKLHGTGVAAGAIGTREGEEDAEITGEGVATGEEGDDVQITREGTSDNTVESAAQIVL